MIEYSISLWHILAVFTVLILVAGLIAGLCLATARLATQAVYKVWLLLRRG
jgi:hypothetical protein